MALIGIGKKIDDTTLRFAVQIPFLAPVTLDLRKVADPQQGWPDWKIYLADAEVGAVWKRTAKRTGGAPYLSGHMESPVFSGGRASIAIFGAKEDERRGQMDMVWSAPKARHEDRGTAAPGSAASAAAPDEDDDNPF